MTTLKKIKMLMTVIPLLLSLSLFSVGFAGWVILPLDQFPKSESVKGSIQSFDAPTLITTDELQMFSCKNEYFTNNEGDPASVGKITAPYTLKLANCREDFKNWNDGKLTIHFSLAAENIIDCGKNGESDVRIFDFKATEGTRYVYGISVEAVEASAGSFSFTEIKTSDDGTQILFDCIVSDLGSVSADEVDFNLVFNFNIPRETADANPHHGNFLHCFGKYIRVKSDGTEPLTHFVTSAWVEQGDATSD